jgi:F420-dependent oxidoreductase-like protein
VKIGTSLGFFDGDPQKFARHVRDLESAGVDVAWGGEIYGFDLASSLAYLAGQTERIELMSGIFPVYSRSPTLIAQTAATIDALSGGRFILGLGTSGPQVIEGWHGVPFAKPLARTREVVEVCRKVWRGERVELDGEAVQLPLPAGEGTGLGKPLKFMGRPLRADIPIFIAAIGPRNVELTAQVAEGWQPIFFVPDKFRDVWGEALDAGMAQRDESLGPLQIIAGGPVAFGSAGDEHVTAAREGARANVGFYVGGMGARDKNFYNDLFKRYGWVDEAQTIQDLFLSGEREKAFAAVPDEFLDLSCLCGDEGLVRDRIAAFREVGVTHLNIQPVGEDPLRIIEKVKALAE